MALVAFCVPILAFHAATRPGDFPVVARTIESICFAIAAVTEAVCS